MNIKKHRLYRKSLASAVLAALALTFVTPAAAQAASGPLVSVTLDQVTGTAPFDADNTAGNDSSATNDVVRTNDNVTYRTEITVGTKKATATHLYVYLPKGEQIITLPPYCLTGSTISPNLAEPGASLTATSWSSLKAQTVDCYLGDLPAASSQIFSITSKVRPEVPDNTRLANVTSKVISGTGTLTTSAVSHRVSAKAVYDVAVGTSASKNGAGHWGPSQVACPNDAVNGCYQTQELPLMISVPEGGRGNSPLLGSFSFTVDLSAKGVFGDKITTTAAWKAAGAKAEATFRPSIPASLRNCVKNTNSNYAPNSNNYYANSTESNSVRESGSVVCAYNETTGMLTVTVTGADTTAWTYPTTRGSGKTAMPTSRAYVWAKSLNLNVPYSTIKAIGTQQGNESAWSLSQTVRVTELVGKALNGSAVTAAAPHTVDWNNYKTSSLVARDKGTWSTFWSGIPGTRGNTPPIQLNSGNAGWDGLPGQQSLDGGDGVLLEDQVGLAATMATIDGNDAGLGILTCNAWDNSTLSLAVDDYTMVGGAGLQNIPSKGKGVWISGSYFAGTANAGTAEIQYGSGAAGSAVNSGCNAADSKNGWFADPAQVKDFKTGVVTGAADAAKGNYKAVNRVRVLLKSPSAQRINVSLAVALRYTGGKKAGETLTYWAAAKTAGYYGNLAAAVADTANKFSVPTYVPGATSDDPQAGSGGSRALVGVATSGMAARFADSAGKYSSGTPSYVAGSVVKFKLSPSIVTPVDTSKSYPMSAEVCLPERTSYEAGSSTVAPGSDTLVPAGKTLGDTVECTVGERLLVFDLGRRVPNDPIAPIELYIKIATSAPNGNINARAASILAGDPSSPASRSSTAALQVESPVGIRIGRTAASTVLEVNPATTLKTPRKMSWNTEFVNLNSPTSVSNVEVYEVLPRKGYGNTSFGGTLAFESAVVAKGDYIKIQYTNTATLTINETTGQPSTATWFDTVALAGGATKVTGLKITRPGAFTPDDNLNIKVTMLPLNNNSGDIYEGRVSGKATGLKAAVGPEISAVEIVASSVGDLLWIDSNKDGLQNAGEVGLSGKTVTLTGTDLSGNVVPARTTVTSSQGKYSFDRLASGKYTVDFGVAALAADDYTLATPSLGKGAADSAPNKTTGMAAVTLLPSQDREDVDAGAQTATKLTASIVANPATGTYISEKDPVDYTLTITNDGTKPYTSVTVDAAVDAGITLAAPTASQVGGTVKLAGNKVTYTGPLAKGETKKVTFKGVAAAGTKEGTVINAKLSGTGTWLGGKQASVCDTGTPAGCTVKHTWSAPKLAIATSVVQAIAADPLATVDEKLTYSFTVTNAGNVPVRAIQAKIQMPKDNTFKAGSVSTYASPQGAGTDLASKAAVDFGAVKHVYTVNQDDVDWGQILAQVTAHGATKNSLVTASSAVTNTVKTPTASALKLTAGMSDDSGDGTAQVGEELTYRFKVVNAGLVTVEGLGIKDSFLTGAGVSIDPEHTYDGRLSPGEAVVFVSSPYVVTSEDKTAKAVTTNTSAKGETRKKVSVESNAHQLVGSTPSADGLDIVKRVTDADGDGFADLGEQLKYTFTVTNNSAVTGADGLVTGYEFHGLSIVDPMLAGVDISPSTADEGFDGRLVPGQTVTYVSGGYAVTAANTTAGKVTNTATAKAVNALNKAVTSNTATASIPTTPTKVIIKTGAGAEPGVSATQGAAGALLLLGAMAVAFTGYRRRYGRQSL